MALKEDKWMNVANNVETQIDGDMLYIRSNIKAAGVPSSSGKSTIIASAPSSVIQPGLKMGYNLYVPVPKNQK